MELSRLISGNVPFVTNIPVYLATTVNGLKKGAVVCNGATGGTRGYTLSVATTTAAAKNAIGVLQLDASFAYAASFESTNGVDAMSFRIQEDLIADRGAAGGNDWLPACINPDAMYYAWYSTTQAAATASDTITQSITASVGTIVTVTSVDVDKAGGWLYSHNVNSTGTPTFSGSLRYINASVASASIGLLTAMNVSTDSSLVYMQPRGIFASAVNSTGQHLRSQGAAGGLVAQGLLHFGNYGSWDTAPMHPLRLHRDNGLNGLTGTSLYSEVILFYHFLNQTTA